DDGGDDNDAGGGTLLCPDHPNITEQNVNDNVVCAISGGDTSPVTQDLTLPASDEVIYLLDGPVFIGDDENRTVLTIEAGVTVQGGTGSFLLIQRGSQIQANGTAAAPIHLTSTQAAGSRGPEDWGGLVINGRAPINNGDANGEAPGEVGTGTYGGNDPADDSGTLRYVVVSFAGNKVDTENELNGIAFQGVGNGTTVEYIQTHMTSDDGVEFFGGTVDVRYLVVSGSDDDSIDWTGGWTGSLYFAAVQQLAESGLEAERGIEADNLESDNSKEPFSDPVLSNVTLVARPGDKDTGIRLRRGTRGELHNFIVTGFGLTCLNVTDAQTETNVADGTLVIANHVLNCTGGPATAGAATDLVEAATVEVGDPMINESWIPQDGSPALEIGEGPAGVNYAGAFGPGDTWADGWIMTDLN
ncbi:MAG: hypothetical protein AAGC55_10430, partial [Myxococcota bacterium]